MSNTSRLAALRSMVRDARGMRVADRLPPERRPAGMTITIKSEHAEPDEDEAKDMDPDREVWGEADDDDPELPGRTRQR